METVALAYIILCIICAIIIGVDICQRPQKMIIMNFVWPLTALYSGLLGLAIYFSIGRSLSKKENMSMPMGAHDMHQSPSKPLWQSMVIGTLHCGSGCTLGDIISAFIFRFIPIILFGSLLFGSWLMDYILAFLTGIIFQYYAIKPMKKMSAGKALVAALKADSLSLTSWQIGMYGWMAISVFVLYHHQLSVSDPLFWLMMQIGMLCGFITAYPINWWLLKKGIKEAM